MNKRNYVLEAIFPDNVPRLVDNVAVVHADHLRGVPKGLRRELLRCFKSHSPFSATHLLRAGLCRKHAENASATAYVQDNLQRGKT
jgi:hypothetical protein